RSEASTVGSTPRPRRPRGRRLMTSKETSMASSSTSSRRLDTLRDGWAFAPRELPAGSSVEDVLAAGESISVPHTWNAIDGQAGGEYRRGRSTYARRIEATDAEGRTWIEFAGVNSSAEVFLDGALLVRHDGGYSTF